MSKSNSRSFTVTLDRDLNDAVTEYMIAQGLEGKAAAVRELLLTALAATPVDGQIVAAKNRAFYECRHWVTSRLSHFLAELARDVKQTGAAP